MISKLDYRLIGFDAGDGSRSSTILGVDNFETTIGSSNVYRIDGKTGEYIEFWRCNNYYSHTIFCPHWISHVELYQKAFH